MVSKHEQISYILRHPEIYSSTTALNAEAQPGWEESVFSSDPPDHTLKREIAHSTIKPSKLKGYEPMVQKVIDDLIDAFIDTGECEFVREFANMMSSNVMFNLLDISRADAGWIADITFEGIGSRYLPQDMREAQDRDGERINEFMLDVIRDRVQNLGDDAISDLIRGHRERKGEDDINYLAVEASVFLLGGVLTTAHLTGSAMRLLLQHPDDMAACRADYKLIPNMLEEAMRLESPLQFMPRVALEESEIDGTVIPKGASLLLIYASANRDESVFPEADKFNIYRKNTKRHIGFGLGPHFCLGAPLARLEGVLSYRTIFDRMENIRFADGEDLGFVKSSFNRGPNVLHLKFDAVR